MKRYQTVLELQKHLAAITKHIFIDDLKKSKQDKNFERTAYLYGELLQMRMKIGNMDSAIRYASTLGNYIDGENKKLAIELADQLKIRIDHGLEEIPNELIAKADFIAHNIRLGSGIV